MTICYSCPHAKQLLVILMPEDPFSESRLLYSLCYEGSEPSQVRIEDIIICEAKVN
jgi:hypothetical protein